MTAQELNLKDGEYTAEVTMEGGSGRATIDSPTAISVEKGEVTAEIKWSSSHYDYMLVDGEKFLPVNTEGNSVFEIPVAEFDEPMAVTADTTAMSVPHEVEYTLTFASETVAASGSGTGMSGSVNIALWIAVAVAVFLPVAARMRRKEKK